MAFCDGNACAAALLNLFEGYHNLRLIQSEKASHQNDVAETHGDPRSQDQTLLQFHTEADLEAGVLVYRRDAIRTAVALLEKKGAIELHRNPCARYKFDKTRYFLFKPDACQRFISSLESTSPETLSTKPENQSRSPENQSLSPENQSPIEKDHSYDQEYDKTPPAAPSASLNETLFPVAEPIPQKRVVSHEDFAAFWSCYPRRVSKGAAEKAFLRQVAKMKIPVETVIAGLERSKQAWAAERRATEFLPHASTWLNSRAWEDDYAANGLAEVRPKSEKERYAEIEARMPQEPS